MGYVRGIACLMASIDYLIVFVIFLAVRSVPQQNTLSEEIAQNRYLPVGYQIWFLYGERGHNPPLPYEIMLCQPRYSKLQYNIP